MEQEKIMNNPKDCSHGGLEGKIQELNERKFSEQSREDWQKIKCSHCGKTPNELTDNPEWINPTVRVSQQPHGKSTLYCNMCQMYVVPTSFAGEKNICPYHQRQAVDEDGASYSMYDEFNQEGEEW